MSLFFAAVFCLGLVLYVWVELSGHCMNGREIPRLFTSTDKRVVGMLSLLLHE